MAPRKKDWMTNWPVWSGKRVHVHVVDPDTSDRHFYIWTDAGMYNLIKHIEGVTDVWMEQNSPTQYKVFIDERYDLDFLKDKIACLILNELGIECNEVEGAPDVEE